MGKEAQKNLRSGKEAFELYYSSLFSTEADAFFAALRAHRLPIIRFAARNESAVQQLWKEHHFEWQPVSWYKNAVLWPSEVEFGEQLPGNDRGLFYVMNASSLLPVLALDVQPGEHVLDACAAPGGKTLALLDQVHAIDSEQSTPLTLIANDTSVKRRHRLRDLLHSHGYTDMTIIGKQAATLFKSEKPFDRILADVPCSSEQHVYTSPTHLAEWSPSRIKQLAQRQIAIASGLFEALKPGGRLVYSTCAVNPVENEGVVAQLLKKKGDRIRLLPWTIESPQLPGMTAQEAGMRYKTDFDVDAVCRILPHRMPAQQEAQLMDPMFVAVFERVS